MRALSCGSCCAMQRAEAIPWVQPRLDTAGAGQHHGGGAGGKSAKGATVSQHMPAGIKQTIVL
jgi:hypothetical protein